MSRKRRNSRGSTLILMTALGILSGIIAFVAFSYVRMLSSQQEQTSAIEAAALAVAQDLTRIIVNDPNFGYVALCDYPPQGAGIAAKDGYGLPVRSINTILATTRLDMIIADQLANTTMKQAAIVDFNNAMLAQASLSKALNSAIASDGSGFIDVTGAPVKLQADAIQAYNSNVIRTNGNSQLIEGSMQLTLGYSTSAVTNSPVPAPRAMDPQLPGSLINQGCYPANQKVVYAKYNFIFSGLANSTHLINDTDFESTITKLPYSLPSAVKIEADQQYAGGAAGVYAVHIQACAQAGGSGYNCPNPGALVYSFPDGCPTEITTPNSLTLDGRGFMAWRQAIGDFPLGAKAAVRTWTIPLPFTICYPTYSFAFANYVWLKRAGPCMNIQDFLNFMNTDIVPANTSSLPLMVAYTFNPATGLIQKQVSYLSTIYASNSDAQPWAISDTSMATASNAQVYDFLIFYNVFQPGNIAGGMHGGEPLVDPRLTTNPVYTPNSTSPITNKPLYPMPPLYYATFGWASPSGGWGYDCWRGLRANWQRPVTSYDGGDNTPANIYPQPTAAHIGDMRPSYLTNGTAVEIAFHRFINSVMMVTH